MPKFNELFESLITELNKDSSIVTILPGSFKPPHIGHWEMIQHYSKISDNVYVIISSPSEKNIRKTKTGKVITSQISKQIFDIFKKSYNLHNVTFEISTKPSPISGAYDKLSELKNVKVILGSSKKDDDVSRWDYASNFVKKNNIPIVLLDIDEYAVEPKKINNKDISASYIRDNIDNFESIKEFFPNKLSKQDLNKIKELLS